jgi:glutamate-5-semialdehyde dehydrogenase
LKSLISDYIIGFIHLNKHGGQKVDIKQFVTDRAAEAKRGARELGRAGSSLKNDALLSMARGIRQSAAKLKKENEKDIKFAEDKGLTAAMIDRLRLTDERIEDMALGLEQVAALPDPVGEITGMRERPNGMKVGRMRVPIGVIAIIYESRPNVTADATALCLKSGNAVLLRGGSEAINSNRAIVEILRTSIKEAGLPEAAVTFLDTPDRQAVQEMLKLEGTVDLVIPRGGEGLIRAVTENSRIPVLKHYKGVCHLFVDRDADLEMALNIAVNAKCQRPGTCNAMETLLVDSAVAGEFLPKVIDSLRKQGVDTIKGCEKSRAIVDGLEAATDEDYHTEYTDLIMNIKVVDGIDEAMDHIAEFASGHTESIITGDYAKAMRFIREVDSSSVMVNTSTRFSDGFEYGLGAEIGIATDKIHARGPMGLEELTCLKFIVLGSGQTRG